jgi:Carboxypeptidase regulatory-like domain/TonB dependent receptor/TonB-dependent Receptor Plug Domain
MDRKKFRTVWICLLAVVSFTKLHVAAQTATATLSGTVIDPSNAAVVDAKITIDSDMGVRRETTSTENGTFALSFLSPGRYRVTAEHPGFQKAEVPGITLNVGDQLQLQIPLRVGAITEAVTVTEDASLIRTSPSIATVVDRHFVANLPMNGRTFQSLIELTPGVVPTTASTTQQGQFSVNGMRESANTFTVDGVSANIGIVPSGANFNGASGQFAGFNALGTTSGLVSLEALQEFTVQTSGFAPEFGRTPGGQISIVTRSGSNTFTGTAFEYFRHDKLDANDFFANRIRIGKQPLRNNQFGGVLGGPIEVNRSFFFVSVEALRQRLPTVAVVDVPSRAARSGAPNSAISEILNAFPIPTGPDLSNGLAQFTGGYSIPASAYATSVRVDRRFGNTTVFGRYNDAPSETATRGQFSNSLSVLVPTKLKTRTLTLAATSTVGPRIVNDVRLNLSRNTGRQRRIPDEYGGAKIPDPSELFPSFVSPDDSVVSINLRGAGFAPTLYLGSQGANSQRQLNVIDTLSMVVRSHQFKFGADYRRLTPVFDFVAYQQTINFSSIDALLRGEANNTSTVQAFTGPFFPRFTNFSAFVQDTWTVSRRFTLTYGIRYEINPAPAEKNGNDPRTVTAIDDPANITLAPTGTRPFKTTRNNFAPRVGASYALFQRPGRETLLRAGAGIFYDIASTQTGAAYRAFSYPYAATRGLPNTSYPLSPALVSMPEFTTAPPYTFVYGSDPNLKLPRTIHFNLGLEQSLGGNQAVSLSYVGSAGRRLYRTELYQNQVRDFSQLRIVRNADRSDYHAMQAQYRRRLSRDLQVLAHYTLSKSLDTSSSEAQMYLPIIWSSPDQNRAPSDFDRRHSFAVAATYGIWSPKAGTGRSILGNFWLDATFRAMSASPVDINSSSGTLGVVLRPDVVPGIPHILDDPSAPGGHRFNRAAFVIRPDNNGTLGRNALRGFPLSQLDMAVRREFAVGLTKLQLRAEAFNILNHPNFGNPVGVLTNSSFGTAIQMLNRNIGGLNALYQIGGPRSIQFALKLQFPRERS